MIEAAAPSRDDLYDSVAKATDRVRDWLNNRLDQDALDIARLYKSSREKLVDRIRKTYEGFLGEDATIARARRSGAYSIIQNTIDSEVNELTNYIGETSKVQIETLLANQPFQLNRKLRRYLGVAFEDLPYLSQRVLDEMTTSIVGGGTFFDHLFNMGERLRHDLHGHVRTALTNGYTFDQLRNAFHKSFGVGKLAEPAYNAYGSVKTFKNEARRQWNKAMLRQAKKMGDGATAVWWALLDPDSTEGCLARHAIPLDDLDDDGPPRHYNCRCTIAVFPSGVNLSNFKAQATALLAGRKVSRRQAMHMEAGWSWGSERMTPLLHVPRDEQGQGFRPVRWNEMPDVYVGASEGDWLPLDQAQRLGTPAHVLLRQDGQVRCWNGWRSIKAQTGESTIETFRGYAVDGPGVGNFDQRSVRVPSEVFERWPALRMVAFPTAKKDEVYAVRVLSRPDAENLALGLQPDEPVWRCDRDFPTLARRVLTGVTNFLPPDAYLAVALPKHVLEEHARIDAGDVRVIVSLATGSVIYSHESFDPSLGQGYQRVSVYCPEFDGTCWAVRPRGKDIWVLPGGHIDDGENPRDAAVREMEEETGVRVKIVRKLGTMWSPHSVTHVFLARRLSDQAAIGTPDEIDAAAPVSHANLVFGDRAFLTRNLTKITEAFDPGAHPRGERGRFAHLAGVVKRAGGIYNGIQHVPAMDEHPEENYSVFTDPETGSTMLLHAHATTVGTVKKAIARKRAEFAAHSTTEAARVFRGRFTLDEAGTKGAKITIIDGPLYQGERRGVRTTLGKQETGKLAEQIVIGYLQHAGVKHVSLLNTAQTNFPIDAVASGYAVEIKGGLISNGPGGDQWRYTIGEPGESEKEWLASAKPEAKSAWNDDKERAIVWRKEQAVKAVSDRVGRRLKPITITTIIDPDKHIADIHIFKGFHQRIGWREPHARAGYVVTVKYAVE